MGSWTPHPMGRGKEMSWSDKDYVKLLLLRPDKGPDRWLIALRTTADYYGWTEKFEVWEPEVLYEEGGYRFMTDPGRRGRMYCESGRKHRISRSSSRKGMKAGLCNQFKVSYSCTLFDLAELAHFTKSDWYWMSGPTGERIGRDRWMQFHDAGTRTGRGAVSV